MGIPKEFLVRDSSTQALCAFGRNDSLVCCDTKIGREDDQRGINEIIEDFEKAIFGKNEDKFIGCCFVYVLFVQKYMKNYRNKQGPKR